MDLEIRLLGNEERLLSSLVATWRESLKISSGSGLEQLLIEDMLEKHESKYFVTLQMILIDSAEVIDRD